MSKGGVANALHKMRVPMFPRNRSGAENSSRKSIDPRTPSGVVRNARIMQRLYITERQSAPEIARRVGVSSWTVFTGLRQCGIAVRSRAEALRGVPRPSIRGHRNNQWRGGVTPWRKRARKLLNTVWVRAVLQRDGFKCQHCGGLKKLEVHHVRTFHKIVDAVRRHNDETDVESFLSAIVAAHRLTDGLTLCKPCHAALHRAQR